VTPLRVAVSVAEVIAGQPVTPTLIARDAAPVNRPPAIQPLPFTGQAQIANDRFVGWHVRADEQRVIVLALELPVADHHALHRAISTIGDHGP